MRVKWRPSLRAVLLLINIVVMLLPLGGIAWLRLYESALVRQTESELLAQGSVVAAAFKAALVPEPLADTLPTEVPAPDEWRARMPTLDLARDRIWPRPLAAAITDLAPDAHAASVGRGFSRVLREVHQFTLAGIRVVDPQGIVVASTAGDFGGQLRQEEVWRALRGETVSLLRERYADASQDVQGSLSRAAGIRVFVAVPVMDGDQVLGAVLLTRTPSSLWNTIRGKRGPLVYAALAMLAVVMALTWLTTRTIARPIAELRAQAQRATRGGGGPLQPLAHAGTREVAELSDALVAMSISLESRAEYIRRFAAQVSHEFKTPLTSIRGAVELLRDHANDLAPAERARFQDIIAADTGRLDRLVRRLLEFARADMAPPGDQYTDALAVLRSSVERARTLGCDVRLQAPDGCVRVRMAEDELTSIFGNLLDNAREHAPQGLVQVEATMEAGALGVRFADSGPGISAANAARIFDPFFTTARDSGNTGLGLSIVRALLAARGGEIRIIPSAEGTVFSVRIPVSGDA